MDGTPQNIHTGQCDHRAVHQGGLDVTACAACGLVTYTDQRGEVVPTVALARLFGDFDLVGTLPAVHAPGQEVLLYRPPTRARRKHLSAFQPQVWFEVDAGLWLSHDEEHLLLATSRPVHAILTGA
ncbi:MAG: hypothetical protein OEM97_01065 [Acidimicrobiia bacterium]|nr:hypothetical protein [Acidimicrobiia bacterium]